MSASLNLNDTRIKDKVLSNLFAAQGVLVLLLHSFAGEVPTAERPEEQHLSGCVDHLRRLLGRTTGLAVEIDGPNKIGCAVTEIFAAQHVIETLNASIEAAACEIVFKDVAMCNILGAALMFVDRAVCWLNPEDRTTADVFAFEADQPGEAAPPVSSSPRGPGRKAPRSIAQAVAA